MWLNSASRQSQLLSWGHWFTVINVFLGLIVSSIYFFAEPMPDSLLGIIYLLLYWVGHIAFLFFVVYILAIFPVLAGTKNMGFSRIWSAVVSTTGLSLLFVDSIFYSVNLYHLDLFSTANIQSDVSFLVDKIPSGFFAAFFVLYAAIFSIEIALSNKLWRDLEQISAQFKRYKVAQAFLGCFFVTHLVHIWADAKVYQPIIAKDNLLPFSYPLTAKNFLSGSGLIDLTDYLDKKELYFNVSGYHLTMPSNELTCQNPTRDMTLSVLSVSDELLPLINYELKKLNFLTDSARYWSPVEDEHVAFEMLFGLPVIYQPLIMQKSILNTALIKQNVGLKFNPSAANLSHTIDLSMPSYIKGNNALFVNHYTVKSHQALHYSIKQLMTQQDNQHLVVLKPSGQFTTSLIYTSKRQASHTTSTESLGSLPNMVSNYDILPSVLNGWLGCDWQATGKRFGQNLFASPQNKDWFVSADSQFIYVWDKNKATFIDNKAKLISHSLQRTLDTEPHSNSVLARAIGQLKQFLRQ